MLGRLLLSSTDIHLNSSRSYKLLDSSSRYRTNVIHLPRSLPTLNSFAHYHSCCHPYDSPPRGYVYFYAFTFSAHRFFRVTPLSGLFNALPNDDSRPSYDDSGFVLELFRLIMSIVRGLVVANIVQPVAL